MTNTPSSEPQLPPSNHNEPEDVQVCSRCIYDDKNVPRIEFDDDGVCMYCNMIDGIYAEYQTGTEAGEKKLEAIIDEMKAAGRGKPYDCVLGVSGGTDSSYLAYLAKEKYGLRPLAVHFDNTWNTGTATENIRKVLSALDIDLYTHVVDSREMDDIYRSFFRAGVVDLDAAADIAVAQILYQQAAKHGVRYLLEGHSFQAEGISPLGTMYADGKYIAEVHKKFGSMKMKTFPNMSFADFMKWIFFYKIIKVRPLWYLSYSKEEARQLLEEKFGWTYYGGHHLENRMGVIHHSFLGPQKFGIDSRNNSLSAAVRAGKMDRADALAEYAKDAQLEDEIVRYFKKRMALSEEEFDQIMAAPPKTYRDYKTYKKTFETFRPLFWIALKFNLIPKSFFIKYTSKNELEF